MINLESINNHKYLQVALDISYISYIYKCPPDKYCNNCPFTLPISANKRRRLFKQQIEWPCYLLRVWIKKRRCNNEIRLKFLLEII